MLCFNNAALFAALKKPTLLRRHGRVNEARTASSGTRRRYGACSPARLDPPRRASTSTVLTHMPGRPSPRRRGSVWHPLPGFRQPRVQFRGAAESPVSVLPRTLWSLAALPRSTGNGYCTETMRGAGKGSLVLRLVWRPATVRHVLLRTS